MCQLWKANNDSMHTSKENKKMSMSNKVHLNYLRPYLSHKMVAKVYSQEKFARATGTHAWVTWSMANPIIWLGGPQRKEAMCLALPVKLQWSTAVLTDRYNFKRRGATQIFSHKTRKSAVHNAPRIETPTSVLCTWNKSDLMCIYDLMNDLHHIRGFTTMRYINWLIPYLLTYVAELLPKWL